MATKSQTSTEYLIVLAVVIAIALIVLGVLGGIPSIGIGANKNTLDFEMRSTNVGVESYLINSSHAIIKLKNNNAFGIDIIDFSIDGVLCNSTNSEQIPSSLKIGEIKKINCISTENNFIDYRNKNTVPKIGFRYKTLDNNAIYTTKYYLETTAYLETPPSSESATLWTFSTGQKQCGECSASCNTAGGWSWVSCNSSHLGQDAYYDSTNKQFENINELIIKDNITNLYWTKAQSNNGIYSSSFTYCNGLNDASYAGYNDWRVPNMNEFLTVLDYGTFSNPTPGGLWGVLGKYYWISTNQTVDAINYYWRIRMYDGGVQPSRVTSTSSTPGTYTVCVRGINSKLIDTGKNFVDQNDYTVKDLNTGLMWQKNYSSGKSWTTSLSYCEAQNTGNYDDWRLPNFNEIITLVDYDCTSSEDEGCTEIYKNNAFNWVGGAESYWTGTHYSTSPNNAYYLLANEGRGWWGGKGSMLRVRCVRN